MNEIHYQYLRENEMLEETKNELRVEPNLKNILAECLAEIGIDFPIMAEVHSLNRNNVQRAYVSLYSTSPSFLIGEGGNNIYTLRDKLLKRLDVVEVSIHVWEIDGETIFPKEK